MYQVSPVVAPSSLLSALMVWLKCVLKSWLLSKNNACLLRYALTLDEPPDTALTVNGREVKAYLLDSARQSAALTVMPMSEALADAPDGGIYVLFESGATHYANGTYRTDHVWKVRF